MNNLPLIDLAVIAIYILGIVTFGSWFFYTNKSEKDYMVAGSSIPGWAVGLSFFGTYLSSNTFIGVVGKSFGSNWNYFTFTLAIPLAVWIGVKYFIPFYRKHGAISAYEHMEGRFGKWARTYSVICYLLLQLTRVSTITFGMALALHGLTGWSMASIIIISGILISFYTVMGGMRAVIWTDVVQAILLIGGAFVLLGAVLFSTNDSPSELFSLAWNEGKFTFDPYHFSFAESTIWVIFLYGLFMNLKAFGFDQNYVQRYHTASSDREAKKSLYFGALLYMPISFLFFLIGSLLFAYYQLEPDLLLHLKQEIAIAISNREGILKSPTDLSIGEIADNALPHFMSNRLPTGVGGLIIAAIMAAAMSSISTSLNSAASISYIDIYKKFYPHPSNQQVMRVLRITTIIWGITGSSLALLMIGVESILAVWWQVTSVIAGAMLGLFLLSIFSRTASNLSAAIALGVGVLVITWIVLSDQTSVLPEYLQSPFHIYMSVVIGTLSIFFIGHLMGSRK